MSDAAQAPWPELPTAAWRETYETLHLWTQIIGKIRLARALAESFLARRAVRHRARTDHLADPRWDADLPDRFRLHRSCLADLHQRRRTAAIGIGRTIGSELLRRCHG